MGVVRMIGVVSGCCCRRYIDFLIILLIPTPLVLALLHYNDIILLTIAIVAIALVICNSGGAEGLGIIIWIIICGHKSRGL